ncbi:MAG: hypothetical protein ACE5I1_01900 [bacterium]
MSRFAALRTKSTQIFFLNRHFVFRHALIFSILAHVLTFLLAAIIVTLFVHNDDTTLPQAIEFIFLPGENEPAEVLFASAPMDAPLSQGNKFKKSIPSALEIQAKAKADQEAAMPDLHFSEGASETASQQPLTTNKVGANLTESSPNPNYLPNDLTPSPVQSAHFYSNIRQHTLNRDFHNGEDFRLSPAQLAIPSEKQKKLLKKLRKLTDTFLPPTQNDSAFVWKDKDRLYAVNIRHKTAENASAFDALEVEVSTKQYGRILSTKMHMQRLGFSQFALFVDYWNPYVMVHDDKFDGRFHTNTEFKLSSGRGVHPKFEGKVTTAGYRIHKADRFGYTNNDSIFKGGLETGTPEIKFPKNLNKLANSAVNDSSRIAFDSEAWIVFYRDGSFSWKSKAGKKSQKRIRLPETPFTIVGQSKKKLHVMGVVHGKVLIYNKGHIAIDGNLTYARAPEIFNEAEDFLGLVSEKNIEIGAPKETGPGDLYVYAAMLAKGNFVVRNYYSPNHGTLFIYGSLTAGSLSATEPRYATRIRFDKRLKTRRPPHFPMTDRYELQKWDGMWEVKQDAK